MLIHNALDGSETIIAVPAVLPTNGPNGAGSWEEKFGIVNGLMTTVHAHTNDQNTQDALMQKATFAVLDSCSKYCTK